MTRTVFHLTSDAGDTSFPDADATPGINVGSAAQDISRYSIVGQGPFQYPLNNDGFNVPYMRFIILDASGSKINTAPRISLKLPNSFNLSNFSDYSKTDQIFGGREEFKNATTGKTTTDESKGGSTFDASTYTQAAGDALRYTLEKGLTNVLGFISSAGIGNASQYEFLNRRAINPQSQLLYKGPQYRKYQIPVTMRPRNQKEADNCAAIIKIFRLASSPTVPGSLIGGSPNDDSTSVLGAGSSFTFGYPHLVQFNINFQQVKTVSRQGGTIQVLYRSKVCAIDSVSVDYGGQKMTFFEDGKPTEMNLTIQLTEITPRTVGDAKNDARSSDSTFA